MRSRSRAWIAALAALAWACSEPPPVFDPGSGPGLSVPDARPRPDHSLADHGPPDHGLTDATDAPQDAAVDAAPLDAATFAPVAFDVQTRVGARNTTAGLENRVTCEVLDQVGEPIGGIPTTVEVVPDTGFRATEVGLVGERARDYRLTCVAPALGLRDQTPADWTVLPDRPVTVTTALSAGQIEAGDTVEVGCAAFDAFGNPAPLPARAFRIRVEPPPPALDDLGDRLRLRTAGDFEVACTLDGLPPGPGQVLQVRPGLPARLAVGLFPQRPVYRVGEVVELVAVASDRFDNPVPEAALTVDSDPPLAGFGAGRLRLSPEGRYALTVTVDSPTFEDRALVAALEILVDFGGPGITCDAPREGDAILLPEGRRGTLLGSVRDVAGVAEVLVDGVPVDLADDGTWRAEVDQRFGLNVHSVVARDAVGNENSTLCAYFAAEAYLPEGQPLPGALQLRLGQAAVDDGPPDRPLRSLGDVIRRVIHSQGLVDTVDAAAQAQNPIVENECRVRVLGACLFRFGAEYTGLALAGPHELALALVDGGLRFRISVRGITVRARLLGTLGNRARIDADHITIGLTFDLGLRANGSPDVRLRSVDAVEVGRLRSDFSGFLTGAILELAFWAFEGLIRRTITDALRGFLETEIDAVLTGLLSGVNLGDLRQGVEVPGLAGGPPVPLTFTVSLDQLAVSPEALSLGVGTKIDGPDRLAERSPGVPLPPGAGLAPLPADRSVGAAVALGLVNQVLHRLWRAGWFEAQAGGLVASLGADLPEGAEVFLRLPQAPAVVGLEGDARLRIFLGPLLAEVVYPGFFVEPFRVQLAAEVEAGVRLEGERDLVFEGVRVADLHLAFGVPVPQRAREVLEDTLIRVVQGLVDRALNDGLPRLPLPELAVPDDLGRFDLPAGANLGLRQPRLLGEPARWILDGNFGE